MPAIAGKQWTALVGTLILMSACNHPPPPVDAARAMEDLAEAYVKLVLGIGVHDPNYVDAYYGPPEYREEMERSKRSLPGLDTAARVLLVDLKAIDLSRAEELVKLRHRYLQLQLQSTRARIAMLGGHRFTFDEEARALYDATPPTYPESHFQAILTQLDSVLPGQGPLAERYRRFQQRFIIPPAKLDAVFQAAIAECRKRTLAHLTLPAGESFVVEYVKDKPWSGYNWYKGNAHSVIQVNTDLPIFIDRAVDLAAHEGYPGHHVYNTLLEEHLTRGRGWIEFSVYPLFSPQSLIAEGTANFGIEVAFPGPERVKFEREVLFPLAGLDPAQADAYYRVLSLTARLDYAVNEAARKYLDGQIDRKAAAAWLSTYTMAAPERAEQRVRFIDTYRSYVINYNLGKDLVRRYIDSHGGTADQPEIRWREFGKLISSPRLPSGLQ